MSQYPATRTVAPPPSSHGIDIKTLLITAVSSAAAAYTCSKLWAPGTLAAAAFTPVLVAVIREALAKSTAVVVKVVPVRGVVRSAQPEGPRLPGGAEGGDWSAADLAGGEAAASGEPSPFEDPITRVAQPGEIAYHDAGRRRRNWRVAIVTGLLGFLVAAVLFTVPELVAGESASGGGRSTTLFGGSKGASGTPADTTTTTQTQTVTTPVEEETVTVAPETVTTPPPAVTTPEEVPEQTPAPTTTEPPAVAEPPPPEVPPG